MKQIMTTNLKQAISNVLELMFFVSVQVMEDENPSTEKPLNGQPCIGATLAFSGPLSGSYYLFIPQAMAREITANFLGLDDDEVSGSQAQDTVKEALNMIGGHMLSLTEAPDNFQLGIPAIIPEPEAGPGGCSDGRQNAIFIEAGSYRMIAGIELN
jgi:CheY-specific phosphatase CheX